MVTKLLLAGVIVVSSTLDCVNGQSLGTSAPSPMRAGQKPASGDDFPAPPHRAGPPGAGPSSSGSVEAEPEEGTVQGGEYVNRYFGLTYHLPDRWREDFKGPQPSDAGT